MKIVDLEHGEKVFGNRDTAKSLMLEFTKSLPKYIAEITSHAEAKKYQALYDKTHSLRGACCYASTPKLLLSVEAIDEHAKSVSTKSTITNSDEQTTKALCQQLTQIAQQTITHVEDNYPL